MSLLTGHQARRFEALAEPINRALERAGQSPLGEDVLTRRAQSLGFPEPSQISANGSCHLLRVRDNVVALNLARPEDRDLLPALFGRELPEYSRPHLADAVADGDAEALVERGILLGLPIARLGEAAGLESAVATRHSETSEPGSRPLVVDLSSLWAGPLCAHLLGRLGGRVVKVESRHRPDAARSGSPDFFRALNDGKEPVALDFRAPEGIVKLRDLLARADIVIEGSRPHVLRLLGIDAASCVRARPGMIWASITAYGREGDRGMRVGFGDDAAVAGGLVARAADGGVRFRGDAIADPLGGLAAARAILAARASGGGVLIDVRLAGAAAEIAAAQAALSEAA